MLASKCIPEVELIFVTPTVGSRAMRHVCGTPVSMKGAGIEIAQRLRSFLISERDCCIDSILSLKAEVTSSRNPAAGNNDIPST